jgi:hypothetical protein
MNPTVGVAAIVLALPASLLQAGAPLATVIGVPVDASEVPRIRELAAPRAAGVPWLLVGSTGQITDRWTIHAYGPAHQTTVGVRRGILVRLSGERVSPSARRTWSLYDSRPYAQVAIDGRLFDDVRGETDPNLPFVVGDITDEELIEIVRFVRSTPGPGHGIDVSRHPIEAVARFRRAADTDVREGIRVSFRMANLHTRWVELERSASGWFVAQSSEMIA